MEVTLIETARPLRNAKCGEDRRRGWNIEYPTPSGYPIPHDPLPVARETCEAVRLMVFSSGGDNEVPKFVVGALCDLFGLARWWIRGDRGC